MKEQRSEEYKSGYKAGYSAGLTKGKRTSLHTRNFKDLAILYHAHWEGVQYDGYYDGVPVCDTWECSRCHTSEYESEGEPPRWAFCPDCGALMDEVPEEE